MDTFIIIIINYRSSIRPTKDFDARLFSLIMLRFSKDIGLLKFIEFRMYVLQIWPKHTFLQTYILLHRFKIWLETRNIRLDIIQIRSIHRRKVLCLPIQNNVQSVLPNFIKFAVLFNVSILIGNAMYCLSNNYICKSYTTQQSHQHTRIHYW